MALIRGPPFASSLVAISQIPKLYPIPESPFNGAFAPHAARPRDATGKLNDDDVVIIAFIQGVADSIRPKEVAASAGLYHQYFRT
jgi:hypothetical protein